MMIAQKITSVMATGGCSFLARTAPATAMAAETPQTASPAPSVAASRRSKPSLHPGEENHRKRGDGDNRGLENGDRPGPDDEREGERRPEQHNPKFDVKLHP